MRLDYRRPFIDIMSLALADDPVKPRRHLWCSYIVRSGMVPDA
jgi:hypothetical protein